MSDVKVNHLREGGMDEADVDAVVAEDEFAEDGEG